MSTTTSSRRPVAVQLHGGFRAWWGTDEVHLAPALQHLVARVALTRRTSRAVLAGELWPDLTERRAHGNLRTAIWQVRRGCPELLLDSGDCLELPASATVDAHVAQQLALEVIRDVTAVATDVLMLHLHAEELLPGWYDEWALGEREKDRQLRLHALELCAGELLRRGFAGAAMHAALAAVQLEPMRESAHRAVILVHLQEGNVAEALDRYARYRGLVVSEFGIEPSPSLRELVEVQRPLVHGGHGGHGGRRSRA